VERGRGSSLEETGKSSEKENRRRGIPVKFEKSRGPSDHAGVTRELTCEYRERRTKSIGVRGFGIRGLVGREFHTS
jgi:hypothetical protein